MGGHEIERSTGMKSSKYVHFEQSTFSSESKLYEK